MVKNEGMNISRREAPDGAPMKGFADKPLAEVRVGVVGMGFRGTDAVSCISRLPRTSVAAICDVLDERLEIGNSQDVVRECFLVRYHETKLWNVQSRLPYAPCLFLDSQKPRGNSHARAELYVARCNH